MAAPAPALTVCWAIILGQYQDNDGLVADKSTDNPYGKTHGAPGDSERHVGDLGNIKTDAQGNAKGSVTDSLIKLIGEQSVLGVCFRLPSNTPCLKGRVYLQHIES